MPSESIEQLLEDGLRRRNNAIAIASSIESDAFRLALSGPVAGSIRTALARIRSLTQSNPRWRDMEQQTNLVREACRGYGGDQEQLHQEVCDWTRDWGNFLHHLSNIGNFLFKELRGAQQQPPPAAERPCDTAHATAKSDPKELRKLNRDLLFAEIALGNCTPSALPPYFAVDVTNVCNFRCRHCYQGLSQSFYHTHLDLRSVDKIAQGMPVAEHLTLGGTGEPSLSPALPVLCELGTRHEVPTEIITNGVALTNPKILHGNTTVLTVSFDGATKRTFEAIRVGSPFETVLQRITDFRQHNPQLPITLNMVVCRANLDEICGVAEWAVKFHASVNLTKLSPYMEHLEPLELRKSDAPVLQDQIQRATQLCAEHGLCLTHSVYVEDSPEATEPIDKEKLLVALEAIKVTQGVPVSDLETSCSVLANHGYEYLPRPLLEAVATAPKSVRPPVSQSASGDSGCPPALDVASMTRRYKPLVRQMKRLRPEEIRVPYCLSPWMRLYVESSSFLRPCCVWPRHFVDLKDFDTLQDALSAEEFEGLRQKTLEGADLPMPCQNCSFAERYHGLPELLAFFVDHGIDVSRLRLPSNFSPPDEVKAILSPDYQKQELEILDWGPQSVEKGGKFNLQPNGSSTLWMRCKGITHATRIVWERRHVDTEVNVAGEMLYARIPDQLYARPRQYRIHVFDPVSRRRSTEVHFSVEGPVRRPNFLRRWLQRSPQKEESET